LPQTVGRHERHELPQAVGCLGRPLNKHYWQLKGAVVRNGQLRSMSHLPRPARIDQPKLQARMEGADFHWNDNLDADLAL